MALQSVKMKNPDAVNLILGQTADEQTLEVINEVLLQGNPDLKFGLSCNRPSGQVTTGTDHRLLYLAETNARTVGVGDIFVLVVEHHFPKEILQCIKSVAAIRDIFCATSKPVEVVLSDGCGGRRVVGVVDDWKPAPGVV